MATLLSLPSELIISIFTCSPTTRTLVHLSSTNRRLHSIRIEHCHHIIPTAYKRQGITHINQAIALTLIEIECGDIPSPLPNSNDNNNNHPSPEPEPKNTLSRLSLPRILHNASRASSVVEAATKGQTQFKISWHNSSQRSEIPRAYYLIRHIVLASDQPHLYVFDENAARSRIGRNHDQWENEWLLVGGWRAVEDVVGEARWNERDGRVELPSWEFEEDLRMGL